MLLEHNKKTFQKVKTNCIDNAISLLNAAKTVNEPNISFHLATISLEEIGKIHLFLINLLRDEFEEEDNNVLDKLDDHFKKIFYAIWLPFFSQEKITNDTIQKFEGIAKIVHEKRLLALYYDPKDEDRLPKDKITEEDRNQIISLVENLVEREQATESFRSEQDIDLINWFYKSSSNKENKTWIFGRKSLDKLHDLNDALEWVKWLKEIYDENEKDLLIIHEDERKRRINTKKKKLKDKWSIKIKLFSLSHVIRQKEFAQWNNGSEFIKLHSTNIKNELLVTLILKENHKITALWNEFLHLSNIFITAVNIGSIGFFWWYLPKTDIKYFVRLKDLERNLEIKVDQPDEDKFDWGKKFWIAKI